jgi:hypothetical protein
MKFEILYRSSNSNNSIVFHPSAVKFQIVFNERNSAAAAAAHLLRVTRVQ